MRMHVGVLLRAIEGTNDLIKVDSRVAVDEPVMQPLNHISIEGNTFVCADN